eukprot:UN27685
MSTSILSVLEFTAAFSETLLFGSIVCKLNDSSPIANIWLNIFPNSFFHSSVTNDSVRGLTAGNT